MYKALYKARSAIIDDPERMTGVAKGKKVEKILPLVGAALSGGASAVGKKVLTDHLQNEKILPTVAAGMALADRAGKKRLNKANGATALATQHNNPDRNRRMVQNGYWESLLLGDDIEKGIGDVARAVGSKLGIGGGAKKPSSLVTARGGSTREAPNVGIGPKPQPPSSFQTGAGAEAERSKSPSTTSSTSTPSTGSGGIITPGSSSGAPKPGAKIERPSGVYSGTPGSAYQGGTPGGDSRSTPPPTTPKKNVTTPVKTGGRGMYSRKPMSQAGAGAGPTASQGSPSTSPESAAQTSGSAARGQAGSGGIYGRGQAGREQYTPPTRAERVGSAAKAGGGAAVGGAKTAGSAVGRLGQRFGAALGAGTKRAGAQVGRELGSAAKAGVKAGVGKLKETAGEVTGGVKQQVEGVKRDASRGDKAAKGLLGFGRALGRVGQAAVGSEPTIGRGSSDTGPGVRGVQQRFTPSPSGGGGGSSSTSRPSGSRPTRTSSSNVNRPRTTSGRVGPVRYNVSQGGNAPSQSSVSISTGGGPRRKRADLMLEMSPDDRIAKSTDIFKRVLTAEAPDETWTGERKERPAEIEKIAPLLAGAAKVAAPIVAGKIADKVLGPPKAAQ